MDYNILSGIRNSRGFTRTIAILVIVAVVGLLLERTIYYTLRNSNVIAEEDQIAKLNRLAPDEARRLGLAYKPKPDSNETKFANTAQNIKEKLATLTPDSDETAINQIGKEVASLRNAMQALDASIRAEFANTAQHITDKKLPAIIQQRQQDTVASYNKSFTTFITQLTAVET
jgi:hypothetical protein